jgi:hypothetical protein
MIVVQMFRIGGTADGAHPTLLGQEFVELLLPDAVPSPQVVLPIAAVEPLFGLPRPAIVAGLAVRGVARAVRSIAGEPGYGLDGATVGAEAVAFRDLSGRLHLTVVVLFHPLGVAGLRAHVEARLAVTAATAGTLAARAELFERLPFPAVATTALAVLII